MIFLLVLSCSPNSLEPWSNDPEELENRCQQEKIPELQITCNVQAAALYGMEDQEIKGMNLCLSIPDQLWKEECHFRLGEELSVGGNIESGLRQCTLAGRFTQNCLTHAIWRDPQSTKFPSNMGAKKIHQAHYKWQSEVTTALKLLPKHQRSMILEDSNARFGYSVYFGTGELWAEPAHLGGQLGAALRTGYAMELARLLQEDGVASVEAILQQWKSLDTVNRQPKERAYQQGRYYQAILSPYEKDLPKINLYGGGKRLISTKDSEDMTIAALEAIFWVEKTGPEIFLPWTTHLSDPIRWTAVKLMRMCESATFPWAETFEALLEHGDPGTRWHIEDAIKRRTHLKKPLPKPKE